MFLSVEIYETKNKIINIINESGLPMSVLSYVVGDIKNEVDRLAKEELKIDLNKSEISKPQENNTSEEE